MGALEKNPGEGCAGVWKDEDVRGERGLGSGDCNTGQTGLEVEDSVRYSESASRSLQLGPRLSSGGDMWSWEAHPLSPLPSQLCTQQGFQESHVRELIRKKHGIRCV